MALDLAELLGEYWASYAHAHRAHLCTSHYRAVQRVLACRTPEMGGRVYRCGGCQKNHYAYHSCNHRSCPRCGSLDQQIWTTKQEARLLAVPYFLITFTIPEELRTLCQQYPAILYGLILRESAAALQDVVATKYHGALCGFTSVLHTWDRKVGHHPHVHIIIPGIAFNAATRQLVHPANDQFLVHFSPLAQRFRSRLHSALKLDHPEIYQQLSPKQSHVLSPAKIWNVQLQAAGQGKTALRYLARYVQRSAFGAKRLLGYDSKGNVRLLWTCSTTKRTSVMTLHPHEFIRRWLLHVLPKGFTRIRHYGFLVAPRERPVSSSAPSSVNLANLSPNSPSPHPSPANVAEESSPSCARLPRSASCEGRPESVSSKHDHSAPHISKDIASRRVQRTSTHKLRRTS